MLSSLKRTLPVVLAVIAGCQTVAPRDATHAVGAVYPVAGDGGWDLLAVDPQRAHLFLSRSDRVQVLDTRDGHLAATLAGTDRVHGIAIADALHRGYTTNGASNSVTEFDLDTLQRIRDISVSGQSPDAVLYDTYSHHVIAFNARSSNASVIDPSSGKEIATISFDGNPELGASDGKGRVFVNIEDKAEIVEIDATAMRVTHTWKLPGCEEPSGLALDAAHARLFSVCQNGTMAITDADSGRQVARVAIGEGPDGAAFDPASQTIFSPNGKSGTLTIVHEDDPDHFRVLQTLPTQASARTIALDPVSHRLYLPTAIFAGQPAPGQRRPPMVPDSFRVLMVQSSVTR
jgi:DNA-binding beta-propeller fold protein YncE